MTLAKKRKFDYKLLERIIVQSKEPLFVTDNKGIVILASPASARILGIPLNELIGADVHNLCKAGYYDRSTVMEAINKKEDAIGIINAKYGKKFVSKSYPLFNDNGELEMILTTSFEENLIELLTQIVKTEEDFIEEPNRFRKFDNAPDTTGIIARSKIMKKILLYAKRAAASDSTIMLYGESGTGKDVLAKYIYENSIRRNAPFVTINCATIPEHLVESELFGYEKGAFTGAQNKGKPGLFEMADNGTVFLDEIAELPIFLQPKLLRILENSEIRRIGGVTDKKINIRIIGATNKNLQEMVSQNKFRDDLFYRLNVIPINIPPLRERREDIIPLAKMFLSNYNTKYNSHKLFDIKLLDAFVGYDWPGNVREVRNIVERLCITTKDDVIQDQDFSEILSSSAADTIANQNVISFDQYQGTLKEVLDKVENQYIEQVIKECNGAIGEAAKKLGIDRTVLYRKRKKHHVAYAQHVVE